MPGVELSHSLLPHSLTAVGLLSRCLLTGSCVKESPVRGARSSEPAWSCPPGLSPCSPAYTRPVSRAVTLLLLWVSQAHMSETELSGDTVLTSPVLRKVSRIRWALGLFTAVQGSARFSAGPGYMSTG